MQTCKRFFVTILVGFSFFIFAQDFQMTKMPEFPSMPEISNSGEFYIPKNQKMNSLLRSQNQTNDEKSSENQNVQILQNSNNQKNLLNPQNIFIDDFLQNELTASKITDIYSAGLFSDVNSLTKNAFDLNQNTQNTQILNQVLQSLNELKEQNKNSKIEEQNKKENKIKQPKILRFKINDYSLLNSFTEVFFSDIESDGTFLLSTDRNYFSNKKNYQETLYMIFKTQNTNGNTISYEISSKMIQNQKNPDSYLNKLINSKQLIAQKVGNLVILLYESETTKIDILLSLG